MQGKSRTAEIIYERMLRTTKKAVAQNAMVVMDRIQTKNPASQLLAIGALMVILLNQYDLSATDVLGIAHNMVFSGEHGNPAKDFSAIKQFMKEEWEL